MPYADPQKRREQSKKYRSTPQSLTYQRTYQRTYMSGVRKTKEHKEYRRNYERTREKEDIQFWLIRRLRSRLRKAIKRNSSSRSIVELLGCTIEQLKFHLESQFRDGMTWDNRGSHWHVDHRKALATFDLTDSIQLFAACHYTNLQPLLTQENLIKGCKALEL